MTPTQPMAARTSFLVMAACTAAVPPTARLNKNAKCGQYSETRYSNEAIFQCPIGISSQSGAGRLGRESGSMACASRSQGQVYRRAGCLGRSEEHTSELQSLMRTSYDV